jgi:hypothetical protein
MKKILLTNILLAVLTLSSPALSRAYDPNTHGCGQDCSQESDDTWTCVCVPIKEDNCSEGYKASNECENIFTIKDNPDPCISTRPQCVPITAEDNKYTCQYLHPTGCQSRTDTCLPGYEAGDLCKGLSEEQCNAPDLKFECEPTTATKTSLFCPGGDNEINTAIGCIPIDDINPHFLFLLKWTLGIIGGTSMFLLIFASLQIITSQGNPRKIAAGKELLIATISGILFLVFSIFLLKTIGYDIYKIPFF